MKFVPYVDGVLIAHFGSFEEVDSNGHINPDDLHFLIKTSSKKKMVSFCPIGSSFLIF